MAISFIVCQNAYVILSIKRLLTDWLIFPSVLWRCWLGDRKGIRPVKNRVVGCWRGYLSGARCRLAYGPADATATHLSLASVKSRLVLPFWYWLTRVVPEKGPLNGCVCVCVWLIDWLIATVIMSIIGLMYATLSVVVGPENWPLINESSY